MKPQEKYQLYSKPGKCFYILTNMIKMNCFVLSALVNGKNDFQQTRQRGKQQGGEQIIKQCFFAVGGNFRSPTCLVMWEEMHLDDASWDSMHCGCCILGRHAPNLGCLPQQILHVHHQDSRFLGVVIVVCLWARIHIRDFYLRHFNTPYILGFGRCFIATVL